jgi:hypothetical protein
MNDIWAFCRLVHDNERDALVMLAQWPSHKLAYCLRAYPSLWPARVRSWMLRQDLVDKEVARWLLREVQDLRQVDSFSASLLDETLGLPEACREAAKHACVPSLWNMVGLGLVSMSSDAVYRVLSRNSERAWPFVKSFHLPLYAAQWDASILRNSIDRAHAVLLGCWEQTEHVVFRDRVAQSKLEARIRTVAPFVRRIALLSLIDRRADEPCLSVQGTSEFWNDHAAQNSQ